jgi:stress-induced morphogen
MHSKIYNTASQKESSFFKTYIVLSVKAMNSQEMEKRLQEAFPGCEVAVIDLTGTSDHFEVRMRATQFQGQSRIQQQRSIMQVFAPELASGEVHALTMKTMVKE